MEPTGQQLDQAHPAINSPLTTLHSDLILTDKRAQAIRAHLLTDQGSIHPYRPTYRMSIHYRHPTDRMKPKTTEILR